MHGHPRASGAEHVVEGSRLIHTLGVSSTANVDDETGARRGALNGVMRNGALAGGLSREASRGAVCMRSRLGRSRVPLIRSATCAVARLSIRGESA